MKLMILPTESSFADRDGFSLTPSFSGVAGRDGFSLTPSFSWVCKRSPENKPFQRFLVEYSLRS
jgi:hypothetical protein